MPKLSAAERAALPDGAFAYVDSKGKRRLPIHDEVRVRNALARFGRVRFESAEARQRAFERVLRAAVEYGIAPVGFVASQMERARSTRSVELPQGRVTLMLTDIEGSTGMAHELGDRYAPLLTDVRRLILDQVSSRGGYQVSARGDDTVSVFGDAADAVEAALALQRMLADAPLSVPVRIRIGLHSGEPALTDSGYEGIMVSTAARVCSAGHGGQILLTAATHHELSGSPGRPQVMNLGAHRLRGLPEEMELFQAVMPGSSTAFPPLRVESTP